MADPWQHILTISLTTFLVRALPFLLIRHPIRSPFLRAFLNYAPYVTLAAMAFPDMVFSTGSLLSGLMGFLAAVAAAWCGRGLLQVAGAACLAVLLFEIVM